MKKITKPLLILVSTLMLLTSCSRQEAASKNETSNVEFLVSSSAATADDFIWNDFMQDKFKLNASFEMAAQDGHLEKLKLLIASNNLPDLISPIPSDTAKKIGTSGMLLNFNDYLKDMPNFSKAIKKNPFSYASLFADDGGLYIAPQISEDVDITDQFRYVPTIRTDLVKEVGMKMPETYDELYNVLKAIKQKHPETLGIVSRTGADIFKDFGFTYGTRSDVCYNYEEDKYVFGPESQNYKEMLKFMNKLWKEGLMDPELFTASKSQFESKVVNGLGVYYMDWSEYAIDYSKTHKSLLKDGQADNYELLPIGPITPQIYPRKIIQKKEDCNLYCSIGISSQTSSPEKLVKFVDWLYSNEGSDVAQYGIKGEHYNIDKDGKYKFTDNIVANYNPSATVARDKNLGINLPHLRRLVTNKEYQDTDEIAEKIKAELEEYNKNEYGYIPNNGINLTFTDEETEIKNNISSDFTTCVNEWSIGLVTGTKSFDDYDKFISEARAKGADKLVEIYNAAYNRFKKKLAEVSK